MSQKKKPRPYLGDPWAAEQVLAKAVGEAIEQRKLRDLPVAVLKKNHAVFAEARSVRPRGMEVPAQLQSLDRERLESLLEKLPDTIRMICTLYLICCFNCVEIAKEMDLKIDEVEARLRKGEELLVKMGASDVN